MPVGACQVCVTNGISGMVHPVISHIQPHMGDIGSGVVGGVEKDQIPCFCFGQWDVLRHIVKKYIQEQEKHDIALDKLSVKEYEDPFKGC